MKTPKTRKAKKGKFARRRQEVAAKREGFVIRDGNAQGTRPKANQEKQFRDTE